MKSWNHIVKYIIIFCRPQFVIIDNKYFNNFFIKIKHDDLIWHHQSIKKVLRTSLATWSIATKSSLDKFHQRKFKQKQINITVMQSKKSVNNDEKKKNLTIIYFKWLEWNENLCKMFFETQLKYSIRFPYQNHTYRAQQFMTIKIKNYEVF